MCPPCPPRPASPPFPLSPRRVLAARPTPAVLAPRALLLALGLAIACAPHAAHAQTRPVPAASSTPVTLHEPGAPGPDTSGLTAPADRAERSRFRTRLALGIVTSILAHEAAHVLAAYAVGGRPSFGFDKGRPTIYSGLNAELEPRKQFIFSSAGLTAQMLLDEALLDVPHRRGGPFERGLLTGGIATALFYITLGRNARVSDVAFMARTSSLSKTQVSLIYGGIAALHAVRIHYDRHYAHFFAGPSPEGALRVGVRLR